MLLASLADGNPDPGLIALKTVAAFAFLGYGVFGGKHLYPKLEGVLSHIKFIRGASIQPRDEARAAPRRPAAPRRAAPRRAAPRRAALRRARLDFGFRLRTLRLPPFHSTSSPALLVPRGAVCPTPFLLRPPSP